MKPDRDAGGGEHVHPARLLVLTRNFPPVIGGIERVVAEAVQALRPGFEVTVIGPRGGRLESNSLDYQGIPAQPASLFLAASILKATGAARRTRPSWVLAGSGVMAPAAFSAARRAGCPVWAFVHGLDVTTQHPLYRSLFVPALRRLDGVIANSHATAEAARRLGAAGGNIVCIHPGVDLPTLPHGEDRIRFRQAHGLPLEARVLLFVGRFISRKGLGPFIDRAL
ncbi:Glycosyltransferase-like protein, partial [mine drainage metagenome]